MRPESPRNKGGFSLIEALVALFVLATCLATILPAFLMSRKVTTREQRVEIATQVAAAELEAWREAGYAHLPTVVGTTWSQPLTQANPLPGGGGTVTFTQVDSSLNPSLSDLGRREIGVTVTWNDTLGDSGSETFSTVVVKG